MSYEPTVWKDGDLVTSAKLNKMEEGIASGGGILVVNIEDDDDTLVMDKTWQEIYNAPTFIGVYEIDEEKSFFLPIQVKYEENEISGGTRGQNDSSIIYSIILSPGSGGAMEFTTESPDDYPVYEFNQFPNNPGEGMEAS